MGIFKDIVDKVGDAVETAANLITSAADRAREQLSSLQNNLKNRLDEQKRESLRNRAKELVEKHKDTLLINNECGIAFKQDPTGKKILDKIKEQAKLRRPNENLNAQTQQHPAMKKATKTNEEKGFGSVSTGLGGDISLILGGEGGIGQIGEVGNGENYRNYGGVGGTVGFSAGADLQFEMGLWWEKPNQFEGPYIGVEVALEVGAGLEVSVIFSPTGDNAFQGFVIAPGVGFGGSAGNVSGGYTWTWGG